MLSSLAPSAKGGRCELYLLRWSEPSSHDVQLRGFKLTQS